MKIRLRQVQLQGYLLQDCFDYALNNSIEYVNAALIDKERAPYHLLLATSLYKALTDTNASDAILYCDSLLCSYAPLQGCYNTVLEHSASLINILDQKLTPGQKTILEDALKSVSHLWYKAQWKHDADAWRKIQSLRTFRDYNEETFVLAQPNGDDSDIMPLSDPLFEDAHVDLLCTACYQNPIFTTVLENNPANFALECKAKLMGNFNETFNFNAVEAIFRDVNAPPMVISLLRDALHFWAGAVSGVEKEVGSLAINFGEIAYDYSTQNDMKHCLSFAYIGRQLLKYGQIVQNVIINKFDEYKHLAATGGEFIQYRIESFAHFVPALAEAVDSLANALNGKGFYSPYYAFEEQQLIEEVIRDPYAYKEKLDAAINDNMLIQAGETALTMLHFIAHLQDPAVKAHIALKAPAVAVKVVKYINDYLALPDEKHFEDTFDFLLDGLIINKIFRLGGYLFKLVSRHHQELEFLSRRAKNIKQGKLLERAEACLEKAGQKLINSANNKLVPDIMSSNGVLFRKGTPKPNFNNVVPGLQKFLTEIGELEAKYGQQAVQRVLDALGYNNQYALNKTLHWRNQYPFKQTLMEIIEEHAKNIIDFESNAGWSLLPFDPTEGNKCILKTIEEAVAGVACEKQGLLTGLVRDNVVGRGDFIDGFGKIWDVKTAKTDGISKFNTFNVNDFIQSIVKELTKPTNENVIIHISYLTEKKEFELLCKKLRELSNDQLKRCIMVHKYDTKKTTDNLIKFLGKK